MNDTMKALYDIISSRRDNPQEGSYTCYLLDTGLDKILKKIGEESAETIIAAKNSDSGEVINEVSDLIFHLWVMLVKMGIPLEQVEAELTRRTEKTGNLKQFKQVDKNS